MFLTVINNISTMKITVNSIIKQALKINKIKIVEVK